MLVPPTLENSGECSGKCSGKLWGIVLSTSPLLYDARCTVHCASSSGRPGELWGILESTLGSALGDSGECSGDPLRCAAHGAPCTVRVWAAFGNYGEL